MKKIAKTLNKIFTDQKFMEELAKAFPNINAMQSFMGEILTYYIATRDTKIYSVDEFRTMCRRRYSKGYEPKNMKRKETVQEALVRNIITEGIVTHSFNGYNLSRIKKNGLGSDKNYDSTLGKELAKLEKDLGVSEYVKQQTNRVSEIYYTSPGANSIYYAMQQSPERLFHGPLNQGRNPLPVIVGEKKEEYYLRVAIDKINKSYRLEEQPEIIENARKVITKLCSKRPQIAFLPINSPKHPLNASLAVTYNQTPKSLMEYLEYQADGDMPRWATTTFFADCLGGNHHSNCANLVSVGVKIPAKELEFVSVPDTFEMLQILAKQKGLQPGEKFDLYSLEKIEEKKVNLVASTKKVEKKHEEEMVKNVSVAPKMQKPTPTSKLGR